MRDSLQDVEDSLESVETVYTQERTIVMLGRTGVGKSFILNTLLLLTCTTSAEYEGRMLALKECCRVEEQDKSNGPVVTVSTMAHEYLAWHKGLDPKRWQTRKSYEEVTYRLWRELYDGIAQAAAKDPTARVEVEQFLLPSRNDGVRTTTFNTTLQYGDLPKLVITRCSEMDLQGRAFRAIDPSVEETDRRDASELFRVLVGHSVDHERVNSWKSVDDVILSDAVKKALHDPSVFCGNGTALWVDIFFVRDTLTRLCGDEIKRATVSHVNVYVPCSILAGGERIVDCPGTNDTDLLNNAFTREALEQATDVFVVNDVGLRSATDVRDALRDNDVLCRRLLDPRDMLRLRMVTYLEQQGRLNLKTLQKDAKLERIRNDTSSGLRDIFVLWLGKEARLLSEQQKQGEAGAIMARKVAFNDIWPTTFASWMLNEDLRADHKDKLEDVNAALNGFWFLGCVMAERVTSMREACATLQASLLQRIESLSSHRQHASFILTEEALRNLQSKASSSRKSPAATQETFLEPQVREWSNKIEELVTSFLDAQSNSLYNMEAAYNKCAGGLRERVEQYIELWGRPENTHLRTPLMPEHNGFYKHPRSGIVYNLRDAVFHGLLESPELAHVPGLIEPCLEKEFLPLLCNLVRALVASWVSHVDCEWDPLLDEIFMSVIVKPQLKARFHRHVIACPHLTEKKIKDGCGKKTNQALNDKVLKGATKVRTLSNTRQHRADEMEQYRQILRDKTGPSEISSFEGIKRADTAIEDGALRLRAHLDAQVRRALKALKGDLVDPHKRTSFPRFILRSLCSFLAAGPEWWHSLRGQVHPKTPKLQSLLEKLNVLRGKILACSKIENGPDSIGKNLLGHIEYCRLDCAILNAISRTEAPVRKSPGPSEEVRYPSNSSPGAWKLPFSPSTGLEDVRRQLEERGLEIVNVLGDGRCLFRVFLHHLTGMSSASDEKGHQNLTKQSDYIRALLCKKLLALHSSPEKYAEFHAIMQETVIEYVSRMVKPTEWGDVLMIETFANVFKKCVVLWIPGQNVPSFWNEGNPEVHIVWENGNHFVSTRRVGPSAAKKKKV